MRKPPLRKSRGFTLVEVMVALAVVAVALPALLFTLYQQIDGTEYLRERSMAQWVASNKLSELRLLVARDRTLSVREAAGESEQAGRTWYWWIDIQGTEIPRFYRVEIRVSDRRDGDANPLQTLVAFITPERDLVSQ